MSLSDLQKEIAQTEKKLKEAARDVVTKPTKDVHAMKKLRNKIAILKTMARQKELVHE